MLCLRVQPSRELRSLPFDISADSRSSCIADLRRLVYEHIAPANPGLTVFAVELSWRDKRLLSDHIPLHSIPFARFDHIAARRNADSFSLFSYVAGYSVDELALACTQTIPTVEQMLAVDTRQAGVSAAEREKRHDAHTRRQQQQRSGRGSDASSAYPPSDSAGSTSEAAAGFDRLFSQLAPSSPDSGAVWQSLLRSPPSATYFRRLLSLDGVSVESWVRLLDANSVYRLVYGLQRIDELLNARLPDELSRVFDKQQRLGWCEEFIKRGGLHNLIGLATNAQFTCYSAHRHVSHALYYECLELLFRLTTDFFALDPAYPASSSIAVEAGLQRGRITQHPAFDALCQRTVLEGVVPTLLQLEQHYDEQRQAQEDDALDADSAADEEAAADVAYPNHRRDMVHSALRLLSGCLACRPALSRDVLSHPSFSSLLLTLLLHSPDEATRMQAARTAWQLVRQAAKVSAACRGQAVQALLGLLRSPSLLDWPAQCRWLFQLCLDAVDDTFHLQTQQSESFLSTLPSLGGYLLSVLRDHRSCELDDDPNVIDELLVGCLRFLTLLCRHSLLADRDSFILFVYSSCLFATANERADGCLCKSTVSRSVAYCALLYASQQSTRCFALLTQLISSDRMWQVDRSACGWRYEPYLLDKEEQGAPVGLRNLGSTCYINSFVQQLFMVTPFRNAVLTATPQSHSSAANVAAVDEVHAGAASQLTPAASTSSDPPSPPSSTQSSPALPECALSRSNSTPASFLSSFAALHAAAAEAARSSGGGLSSPPPPPPSSHGLLFHLQQLFGHLQLSRKAIHDTMPLCGSLRDAEGVPINLRQQKDVNEFAGQVFDQLEAEATATTAADSTQPTEKTRVVGGVLPPLLAPFRGVLLNQMLSRECAHVSEREEPFYMLSVTVKHKASLHAALDLLVEGELMDGDNAWQCNECALKRAAVKRCCLSSLPNHLILHLKRFEFDFDAMKTQKINDRFSFPLNLNMHPYTKKHGLTQQLKPQQPHDSGSQTDADVSAAVAAAASAADASPSSTTAASTPPEPVVASPPLSDFDYRLSGILVHSGVAEAGHYYSYVRSGSGSDDDSWIELNDELVTPFDPSNIPQAAFGGHEGGDNNHNGNTHAEHSQQQTNHGGGSSRTATRDVRGSMTNAYMLFYERREPSLSEQLLASQAGSTLLGSMQPAASSQSGHPPSSAPSSPAPVSPSSPRRADGGAELADSLVHRAAAAGPLSAAATLHAATGKERNASVRLNGKYALGPSSSTLRIDTKPPSSAHSSPLHTPSSSGSSTRSTASTSRPSRSLQLWLGSIPSLPAPSSLPGWLVRSIWQDNVEFLRDKALFDFSCQSFLFHVCSRMAGATQQQRQQRMADTTQQAQIATLYVFKVLCRSAENGTFYQWMELLRQLYRISPASRAWLLAYLVHDPQFTQQIMFFCPHAVVRDAFCELLSLVVDEQCRSDSQRSANKPQPQSQPQRDTGPHASLDTEASAERTQRRLSFADDPSSLKRDKVVSLLLSWLPVVQCAARTYSAYFRCLIRFARSRASLRQWMVEQGAIAALVAFYTCSAPVPQFNCRVSPPVLSFIVQQQQVCAPKSLREAHDTVLSSFAHSVNAATVRRMHPHHGHLAVQLLATLVQHNTRRQPLDTKHATTATALLALTANDRRALLTGLLADSKSDVRSGVALTRPSTAVDEQTASAAPAQPSNSSEADSRGDESSAESASDSSGTADSSGTDTASSTSLSTPTEHSTASSERGQAEAVSTSSTTSASTPDTLPPRPAVPTVSFPFFPYVLSDASCSLSTAELTVDLALNDSRLSSAVLDAVLSALVDALQAQSHRVYDGVAVANAPLHTDSLLQQQPPPSGPNSHRADSSTSALVCGVHDFVGPLSALSALLSLRDRLSESRVDECLSRLLVLARRVAARRPAALCPPGSSAAINGSEERFLLAFVRCVLQLAANHRLVAAWLKAHSQEWHFLEQLYTQARHMLQLPTR